MAVALVRAKSRIPPINPVGYGKKRALRLIYSVPNWRPGWTVNVSWQGPPRVIDEGDAEIVETWFSTAEVWLP
jgi:hypothetical protein